MDISLPPRQRHTGCLVIGILTLIALLTGVGLFFRQVHKYYVGIKNGDVNPLLERKLFSTGSGKAASQKVTPKDLQRLMRAGAPDYGSSTAKLTVVEFVDFDCPHCRTLAPILRQTMESYKDQVHFVFRQFPLEEIHPTAIQSAHAALCAHEQGKFLEYYDQLYANQEQRTEADFYRFATIIRLDQAKFDACLKDDKVIADIQQDLKDGLQVGVQGTPTLFFNDLRIQGAPDQEVLEFLIQRFLKGDKT